jgi:hypothetical protein
LVEHPARKIAQQAAYVAPEDAPFVAARVGHLAHATDHDEERRAGPLLLGNAAVVAHRFERRLAAEMDENQRRGEARGRK